MADTPQQMAERLKRLRAELQRSPDFDAFTSFLLADAAEMLRACPSIEARQEAYEIAVLGLIFKEDAIRMRELLGLPVNP